MKIVGREVPPEVMAANMASRNYHQEYALIRSAMYSSIEDADKKAPNVVLNPTPDLVPILSRSHNTLFKY